MDSICTECVFNLKKISHVALDWWKVVNGYKVFAFHGLMGSGKTTFIHALCEVRKVTDPVTSPTFSLINEYRFIDGEREQRIFHIDLFRVQNEEEAVRAGIEDCLYSGNICFVEWPENAPGIFPENTVQIFLETINAETRKLKIHFPDEIL
jgi:tRNA threonylcarbamoyladenosine biosynthesis protein TsaE